MFLSRRNRAKRAAATEVAVQERPYLNCAVLTPNGTHIDFTRAPKLRRILKKTCEDCVRRGCKRLVLDLREMTVWDSSSLTVLVSVLRSVNAAQGHLALVVPERFVALFQVTRLDRVFPLFVDLDEAVHAP